MGQFIFHFPKVSTDNYFTYEVITFIAAIVLLIVGFLLCFWGYKYFQTLVVVVLGTGAGVLGLYLTDSFIQNPVIKMFIFVMFLFFGTCIIYLAVSLIRFGLKKLRLWDVASKNIFIPATITGIVLIAVVTYYKIYNGVVAVSIMCMLLLLLGLTTQNKNRKKHVIFHCYDDICAMKPLKSVDMSEKQGDAND